MLRPPFPLMSKFQNLTPTPVWLLGVIQNYVSNFNRWLQSKFWNWTDFDLWLRHHDWNLTPKQNSYNFNFTLTAERVSKHDTDSSLTLEKILKLDYEVIIEILKFDTTLTFDFGITTKIWLRHHNWNLTPKLILYKHQFHFDCGANFKIRYRFQFDSRENFETWL